MRAYDQASLHGLALRLMRLGCTQDLSQGQEWLWSACISELEYRWRRAPVRERCSCQLCLPPFPELEVSDEAVGAEWLPTSPFGTP